MLFGAGGAVATPWLLDRAVFVGAHLEFVQRDPPDEVETFWVERPGGVALEGWFLPAGGVRGPAPAILYFHGNAELIDNNIGLAESYAAAGYHVLLAEYRGYGRSTGEPDIGALPNDARAFYDRLAAMPEVDRNRIVVLGRSLGGAAAGAVMAERAPCAVVLEQTFTNLADMVSAAGFPRFLAGDSLDTLGALEAYTGPVLVSHGRTDDVIPFAHGRRLAEAAADRDQGHHRFAEFSGRHNPMAPFPEIREVVLDFLGETRCGPGAGS